MILKYSIILSILLSSISQCFSQIISGPAKINSIDYKKDLLYESELVWGINFNTNGGLLGGFYIKKSKAINKKLYRNYSLEIVNVKHNKEIRQTNPSSGGSFIFSKNKYFFALRPQYGREYVLFQKARKQGMQVNAIGAIGPAIGLQAPYLIEYDFSQDNSTPKTGIEVIQYNGQNPAYILRSGHLIESILRSKIVSGLSFKASLSFEMSTFKTSASGFEVGFMLDVYSKDIMILTGAPTENIYSSVFLTFYYGKRK